MLCEVVFEEQAGIGRELWRSSLATGRRCSTRHIRYTIVLPGRDLVPIAVSSSRIGRNCPQRSLKSRAEVEAAHRGRAEVEVPHRG